MKEFFFSMFLLGSPNPAMQAGPFPDLQSCVKFGRAVERACMIKGCPRSMLSCGHFEKAQPDSMPIG